MAWERAHPSNADAAARVNDVDVAVDEHEERTVIVLQAIADRLAGLEDVISAALVAQEGKGSNGFAPVTSGARARRTAAAGADKLEGEGRR